MQHLPTVPDEIINYFIENFGENQQKIILIEECTELQKEMCKQLRKDTHENKQHIIEEMAHVLFSMQTAMKILNITTEDIQKEFEKKYQKYNLKE